MLKYLKDKVFFESVVCPWWLAYTFDNRIRKIFHDPDKILKPYVKDGMIVLDIGCGMGYFSIAMAGYVGGKGRVIALDIQEKMLRIMKKRAGKAGVLNHITPRLSSKDEFGIKQKADFALSFWMVHEVPDKKIFLEMVYSALKPRGRYLIVEPKLHTSEKYFNELISLSGTAGFKVLERPAVSLSRAVLLGK